MGLTWNDHVCSVCYLVRLVHAMDDYELLSDWELPQKYFICEPDDCDIYCKMHSQNRKNRP